MASTSDCAKADEVDLVGHLSPVIGVGDEEDTVAELVEWPRLKGSRVEYPTGSSRFREFGKAKCSIDGIWGHAFGYRGSFFRTCSVSQGGDYLYLLPDLAKEKKCRRLGDKVSLEYVQGMVKDSRTDSFCCYLAQFGYGLTLPLSNLAKSVMNMIGACPAQLNCNFWEVILVCKTLNERWAASATDGAYLSSSSSRPCFFDLSSAGRVWNDNLLWVSGECLQRSDEEPLELNNRTITKGISYKVSRKESLIDTIAKEGTELDVVLKELEISRFKRVASKDDKVRRSQAKMRMAGKTPVSMEKKLLTPELNTPFKLSWLNEMPDEPVDMATVSSNVIRNLTKRKAAKRGAASRSVTSKSVVDSSKRRKVTSPTKSQVVLEESDKIAEGADLRPRFEVEAGLLVEQCLAKAREKMVTVVDDEFKKFARALRGVELGLQDRSIELERRISQLEGEKNQYKEKLTREREVFQLELEKEMEVAALKLKEARAESVAEADRLVTASATSRNNLAGNLYQLRYTKAEILAFSEGNYEEKEIVDEEEVEEMEDGPNVVEKTTADNQETINQKELDVAREREEQTLLYIAEYANEYEALILQYEDRLDDNVKLSLKLKEANRQVEDKTVTILSKDLALNQLTSKLVELKEKAASGSRHEAIRALNEEISDMKYNICALNEQLLKRKIDLDTARTNLVVSEANFENLSSSIVGKDLELRNSAQIRDSLTAKLDRLMVNLRHLKGREAQSRADLAEVQAKNKSLMDELAHARRNVRRAAT
ncbi:hypothetical protein GIB67_011355 [Kingdonia uniflora]|uniref:Uncharacterized protein n=1 Tax=Kingdonia uniflora TaxID=39325 RepID=A0A7J7LCE3_9MAGN|nr:hypothetical protein GIB67_011355 [Kingdonia uniflora]